MSFNFFHLLTFTQFFIGGIYLYNNQINSVEDIILGSVVLWSCAVIILSVRSAWSRFEQLTEKLTKIPQSESYRASLASGLTCFILSIVLLAGSGFKIGYEMILWFVILFVSSAQLVKIFKRGIFQYKVNRRFNRYRQYLRLKTN